MPVTAADLKITIRGTVYGEQFENIQWYRPDGAAFLTATVLGVAESYWNDIKTTWRAFQSVNGEVRTNSILISEPGLTGAYAEFPIPEAERLGSRTGVASNTVEPCFMAAGVRLTVGTRTTRPGQKRFPGMGEVDVDANLLVGAYVTLVEAVAVKFSEPIELGAPVATGVLHPEITRVDPTTKLVVVRQDVTGFVVNPAPTTQNSRKVGRGA